MENQFLNWIHRERSWTTTFNIKRLRLENPRTDRCRAIAQQRLIPKDLWGGIAFFSYPLLLNRSAHTHKPSYNSEEVHCAIISSPIENISSATRWCVEFTCKNPVLDATRMWRGQWVMGLECPQTVQTTLQRNGSVTVKRIFN